MCKKLIVICMLLGMASYASAATIVHDDFDDTMVSSFESGMDGWAMIGSNTSTPAWPYGATDGMNSLKLNTVNSWWNEVMEVDLGAMEGGSEVVFGNNTFSVDVTWLASEYVETAGAGWHQNPKVQLLINPSDMGYNPDGTLGGNWWGAGEVELNVSADGAQTLSWNYQTVTNGGMNSASTQLKFKIELVQYCWDPQSALYLDNVKFTGGGYIENTIPEPATMALLGLGSLALLRRKK